MPKFDYVALDSAGKEKRGTVEASNENEVIGMLREKGVFPTSIAPEGKAAKPKKARGGAKAKTPKRGGARTQKKKSSLDMEIHLPKFMQRVKAKHLATFTRQLATLVDAGLPLVRGLKVLERQEKSPVLKDSLAEMSDTIQSGSTFAESLAAHPRIFNKLFVNMVKAGEVGGVLDKVLVRLAEFMEKAEKIKGKIKSAMAYPVVVTIVAVLIVSFLMIRIIPQFEEIFTDLPGGNGKLPALTQWVLNISRLMTEKFLLVVAVIAGLIALFLFVKRIPACKYYIDKFKLSMPVFGNLVNKTTIARFSRTLGTLMNAGVPVLQSLNIVKDTTDNEVVAQAIGSVHDAVKEGENMAPPIEATRVFPPIVVSMVEVGEETGELPEMLLKVADAYDEEVDNAVSALTSVIEPILIVGLAIVIGTIVIALFLPMIEMIGNMG